MKRTLIAGGGGFVGLNIAECLLRSGHGIVLLDRVVPDLALSALQAIGPPCTALLGDVRDPTVLQRACEDGVDAVVLGAAITADAVRDATDPESIIDVNLSALVRQLRAARDAGARRVINLSSIAALGRAAFSSTTGSRSDETGRNGPRQHRTLLDEATLADPESLYGITKFAGERIVERLGDLWCIDVCNVRLSGVFGPWERLTGARSTPSPQFQIAVHALAGRHAILDRPGMRDWLYAPDVGAAMVRLIEAQQPARRLYHLSSSQCYTALAWGRAMAAVWPMNGFVCRLAEPGEAPNVSLHGALDRLAMSTAQATADLGFTAAWQMQPSVQHYCRWIHSHPGWLEAIADAD